MSPLLRRGADTKTGVAPRRPHAGLLRRERRALGKAREDELHELGGLLVEMYRRGAFREDLLAERAAQVVGIDARLAEIEELLTGGGNVVALRVRRADPAWLSLLPELRTVSAHSRQRRRPRLRGDRDRARTQALMASEAAERRTAIAAADTTCPRCGAVRERDRPLLPGLRVQAAGRRGNGAWPAARLAAAVRLVSRATGSGCRS